MHATEVEIAFRRHVCDVCGYLAFFAQLPYRRARFWIVYRGEYHSDVRVVQVGRLESSVVIFDLFALDAMRDLWVQSISGAD